MKTKLNEELDHIRLELRMVKYDLYQIMIGRSSVDEIQVIRLCLDNIISFMEDAEEYEPETWSFDATRRRFAYGSNLVRTRLGMQTQPEDRFIFNELTYDDTSGKS